MESVPAKDHRPEIFDKYFSRKVVWLLACLVFLACAAKFLDHTVDDAFISFRYAKNLVEGHGLVFNPGERVEGYTNFLWVILSAFSLWLSLDPAVIMKLIGLVAAAGMIAAVVRFSPKPDRFRPLVYAAPVLLAASPSFAVWASGGLETPLFACLITWGLLLAAKGIGKGEWPPTSAVLLGFAAWARPEGVLIAGLVFLVAVVIGLKKRIQARKAAIWLLAFAAVYLPYFIWRFSYYGALFPNTFYAKVDLGGSQLLRGLVYLHGFMAATGYWLIVGLFGLIWTKNGRFVRFLGSVLILYVLYVVYIGGDGLPMYRFFVPGLGVFFILVARGLAGWLDRWSGWKPIRAAMAIVLILAAAYSMIPSYFGPDYDYVVQDRNEVDSWTEIGKWFKAAANPDDSIAVIPAGAIPYYSELKTVDMLGLNDLTIGRKKVDHMGRTQAGHEKFDVDYVLSRKPTYIIVGVYGLSAEPLPPRQLIKPYYPAETELLKSRVFEKQYSLKLGRTPKGYFCYFARNTS